MTNEKWEVKPNGDGGDFIITPVGLDSIIAEVIAEHYTEEQSERHAHQIAHDHNTHATLVEALEVASEALDYRVTSEARDKINAALAAAKGGPK